MLCMLIVILTLSGAGFISGARGRMQEGNRLYEAKRYAEAGEIYGNLAVDLPNSPQVQHNMGLAYYRTERWNEALDTFRKGIEKNGGRHPLLEGNLAYNQGAAYFRLAGQESEGQGKRDLLTQSLEAFRRAVRTNPRDMDAKFNYELVQRMLAEQDQSPEPPEQNGQDQGRDGERQDQQDQGEQGGENGQSPEQTKPDGADQPTSTGALTPAQAAEILKQAGNLEKYGAILVPGSERAVEKDW